MAWEEILISALAILPYLTTPHILNQILFITVFAASAILKLLKMRTGKKKGPEKDMRIFGVLITTIVSISVVYSLPNLAYTGTSQSMISALLSFILAVVIANALEEIAYELSRIKKLFDGKADITLDYLITVFLLGAIGFLFTGAGMISAAGIIAKKTDVLATDIKLISTAGFVLGIILLNTVAKGIWSSVRTTYKKYTLFAAIMIYAVLITVGIFGIHTISTQRIAETTGVPIFIITILTAIYSSRDTKVENATKRAIIMMIKSIVLLTIAGLLPIMYATILPESFDIDCTLNFEEVNGIIFAYGPQEVVVYPPHGVPKVVEPWTPKHFDVNTFCNSKFKIITSLGKISCDPRQKICKKRIGKKVV